jgi:RNA polymerase sigma factor (sigma-70 family)
MSSHTPGEVSRLLDEHRRGSRSAVERLMPLVYDELRRIAAWHLRAERPDHTLQPTALVHEAFMRLADRATTPWESREREEVADRATTPWESRAHFFALAAQVMRHVLIDHARARDTGKRGGRARRIALDDALLAPARRDVDLVALDDALRSLAEVDERKSRIVEMRFLGGLEIEETAEVLGVSTATVRREWTLAKAWLRREMRRGGV